MSRSTASSRSESYSSTSSTASNLSDNARTILTALCNERDFSCLNHYISSDVTIQHNDNVPTTTRKAFLSEWQEKLRYMPDAYMDIKEACVDEKQMKVWVRSEITGLPGGKRRESIDMMTFNEDGVLISSVDCQRTIRDREDEE